MSAAATACVAGPGLQGQVYGRRRLRNCWSWGRGSHVRLVAGTVSIAGLHHSLIGRRMEKMEMKREMFFWEEDLKEMK